MVSYKRHILKSVTWRIAGTLDTILLSYLISGDIKVGITSGGVELFTKMIVYFIHERIWYKYIKYGVDNNSSDKEI